MPPNQQSPSRVLTQTELNAIADALAPQLSMIISSEIDKWVVPAVKSSIREFIPDIITGVMKQLPAQFTPAAPEPAQRNVPVVNVTDDRPFCELSNKDRIARLNATVPMQEDETGVKLSKVTTGTVYRSSGAVEGEGGEGDGGEVEGGDDVED